MSAYSTPQKDIGSDYEMEEANENTNASVAGAQLPVSFTQEIDSLGIDLDPINRLILATLHDINTEVVKIGVISKKQDNLNSKFDSTLKSQNNRLAKLENENKQLHTKVSQLQNDNLSLQRSHQQLLREMKKCNLIIHGNEDTDFKSNENLKKGTEKLLTDLVGHYISVDTTHRLGQFKSNWQRPVRVKLLKHSDRDSIMFHREKRVKPKFIKEDLPFQTRRDNAILWKKKDELEKTGPDAKIDWNRKQIFTNDALFELKEGEMVLCQQKRDIASSSSCASIQEAGSSRKRTKIADLGTGSSTSQQRSNGPRTFLGPSRCHQQ
ncbi:unnamed protein product [Orchesella dallaii]|uniref:Uncharacterized protein n=1 Tax=Orchesella dallaii TaxID=48710 RepID=A0ABP1S0X5_9HEXA